jgi:hypothetical protein
VRTGEFPHRETAEVESGSREAEAGEQEESQSEFCVSHSFLARKTIYFSAFQSVTLAAPKPIIDQNDLADLNYKEMLSLLTDQSQPAPQQPQDPSCTCAPNVFQYFYDFQQAYYGSNPYL